MRIHNSFLLPVIFALAVVGQSCTEDDPNPLDFPVSFTADNTWTEGDLNVGEIIWYRVKAEESFTTLYIEWAEAEYHGSSKTYTGDIKVSAFMLDGTTAYFEDKDNGYGDKVKSFTLDNEKEVLLKVELNDVNRPGTYAIRSTGTSDLGDITYIPLSISDIWTADSISDGEVIGYIVDCGELNKVTIIWAESGSPEDGYTADIMGSVFHLDGQTPYSDLGNGKDILNKNKSQSDDPKSIQVEASEKSFKIHLQVNTAPGTYAVKVIPFE